MRHSILTPPGYVPNVTQYRSLRCFFRMAVEASLIRLKPYRYCNCMSFTYCWELTALVYLGRVLQNLRCIVAAGLPSLQHVILQICIGSAVALDGTSLASRRLVHSAYTRPQFHHCLHHCNQLEIEQNKLLCLGSTLTPIATIGAWHTRCQVCCSTWLAFDALMGFSGV